MKVRLFNKIITIDENNPGIKFWLEECCEFPTEAWFKIAYSHKNWEKANKPTRPPVDISAKEIEGVIQYGIIEALQDAQECIGKDLSKEIECVKNAY